MQDTERLLLSNIAVHDERGLVHRDAVSADMKVRLRALGKRRQLTESGLLKQFVEVMLHASDEGTRRGYAATAGARIGPRG